MSGIRRTHRARALLAIERDCIGAELLTPEAILETLGEPMRLHLQPIGDVEPAEPPRAARGEKLACEYIALHFGKRDIAFGETAIGVEDRVIGILPALIAQAGIGRALVFDKAVAIGIARPLDPA